MTALTVPSVIPFTLAALVMGGLVLVEGLSLVIGHSASALLDGWLDHEVHGFDTSADSSGWSPAAWLSWLNVGRIPFLVLMIAGLALFAMAGFAIQSVAGAVLAPLPVPLAVLGAVALAVPGLRGSSRFLARVIPKDETYVVSENDLVGATGEVTLGPLDGGLPGTVRVVDRFGNVHSLRARAAEGAPPMKTGERVLLVDRTAAVFTAVPATPDL